MLYDCVHPGLPQTQAIRQQRRWAGWACHVAILKSEQWFPSVTSKTAGASRRSYSTINHHNITITTWSQPPNSSFAGQQKQQRKHMVKITARNCILGLLVIVIYSYNHIKRSWHHSGCAHAHHVLHAAGAHVAPPRARSGGGCNAQRSTSVSVFTRSASCASCGVCFNGRNEYGCVLK